MADEPKAGLRAVSHLVLGGLNPDLARFSIYSGVKPDSRDQLIANFAICEIKGVNDLTVSPGCITGKLLPNGIEELAKLRKEPDLPQKMATIVRQKGPLLQRRQDGG